MQVTDINSTSTSNLSPAVGDKSPDQVANEFAELIGDLSSRRQKNRQRNENAEALAGLFVSDPRPQEIAQKTSEVIRKDSGKEEQVEERSASTDQAKTEKQDNSEVAAQGQKTSENKQEKESQTQADRKDTKEASEEAGTEQKESRQAKQVQTTSQKIKASTSSEVSAQTENVKTQETKNAQIANIAFEAAVKSEGSRSETGKIATEKTIQNLLKQAAALPEVVVAEQVAPIAILAGIVAELNKSLLLDGAKVSSSASVNPIEAVQRTESIAPKTREAADRVLVKQEAKDAPQKKDLTLAVQKIEAALKEAALSKDGKSISLRLDPPSLGEVKVEVTLKDGGLYARIVADNPHLASLVRERSGELLQGLRKLGLNVDEVNVFVGTNAEQQNEFKDRLPQQNPTQGALELVTNDDTSIDPKRLVPVMQGEIGLYEGWVA